jgi:hypothetical protein
VHCTECTLRCAGNQTANAACSHCECPAGFQVDGTHGCIDIDECAHENGGCAKGTVCFNTLGSRMCGECPDHHFGSGYDKCFEKKFVTLCVAAFVVMVSTLLVCQRRQHKSV